MSTRTITNPATNSSISSSVIRSELQTLENEVSSWFTGEAVVGTINSSNKVFTIANTPRYAIFLLLGHQPQIQGVDFTLSGTTITYVTAPDAAFSGDHYATYL